MKNLEILKTGNGYTVIVDGVLADKLTVDEALGCVVSALISPDKPLFVRTYTQWNSLNKKKRYWEFSREEV